MSRSTFDNFLTIVAASAVLSCLGIACSGDDGSSGTDVPASGGATASGGAPGTGAASSSTGGTPATGGASSGGTTATGGASTGGTTATGGASTGGTTATGGASTGGTTATGGASTGGTTATGGASTGGVGKACNYGAALKACVEFTGSGFDDDAITAACTGGQLDDSCPATDAYGTCTTGAGTAAETVAYYYDGNGYPADGGPCTQGGGTWQSL